MTKERITGDDPVPNGDTSRRVVGVGVLALFTTLGTLLCCALPILLVTLGFGSVVAALTLHLPFLVTLSEHKDWIFAISAILLALAGWLLWRPASCPADAALAAQCRSSKRWGWRLFWLASGLWTIGFFASYLLLPLRLWLDP